MTRTERVQQLSERFYVASTNLTPSEATKLAEMAVAEMADEVVQYERERQFIEYGKSSEISAMGMTITFLIERGLKD